MHDVGCRCRPYDDDSLYTISVDPQDIQCIAPIQTRGHPRCRHRLAGTDIDDVRGLHRTITTSQDAAEILRAVRALVLSQCCQAGTHRAKLEVELTCRAALVEALLLELADKSLLQTVVVGTELDPEDDLDADGVVKYHDTSALVLTDLLKSKVDLSPKSSGGKELPRFGVVYALRLPSLPKLIKIGFSGKTAESRRLEWTNCFPGATILVECSIAYPERMEQLIHLQLAKQRRQIAKCKSCNKTHLELFEMSGDDAKQLIHEWQSLADQEPIYDSLQQLTAVYSGMLKDGAEELTARVLLDMLAKRAVDAEAKTITKTELDVHEEVRTSVSGEVRSNLPAVDLRVKQETPGPAIEPTSARLILDHKEQFRGTSEETPDKLIRRLSLDDVRQVVNFPAPVSDLAREVNNLKLDRKETQIKVEVVELPSTLSQYDDPHGQAQPEDDEKIVKHLIERVAGVVIEQGDTVETIARRPRNLPILKPISLQDVNSTARVGRKAY